MAICIIHVVKLLKIFFIHMQVYMNMCLDEKTQTDVAFYLVQSRYTEQSVCSEHGHWLVKMCVSIHCSSQADSTGLHI